MTHCLICNTELSTDEQSLNARWHFACETCHYCKEPMPSPQQIEKCLSESRPVSHNGCWQQAMKEEFKNKTLPITIQHLRYLNDQLCENRNFFDPSNTDFNQLSDYLIASMELTKNVSCIRDQVKQNIRIREDREWLAVEIERHEEAKEKQFIEQTETLEKQKKAERRAAERENPQLKRDREGIEAYARLLKCSFEEARSYLEAQKARFAEQNKKEN